MVYSCYGLTVQSPISDSTQSKTTVFFLAYDSGTGLSYLLYVCGCVIIQVQTAVKVWLESWGGGQGLSQVSLENFPFYLVLTVRHSLIPFCGDLFEDVESQCEAAAHSRRTAAGTTLVEVLFCGLWAFLFFFLLVHAQSVRTFQDPQWKEPKTPGRRGNPHVTRRVCSFMIRDYFNACSNVGGLKKKKTQIRLWPICLLSHIFFSSQF